jgi:ribosome-associated protein
MEDLKINKQLAIPGSELNMSASRSGGPGGQHVNKTSSRVRLQWSVADSVVLSEQQRALLMVKLSAYITNDGVMQVTSSENSSQHRNRENARERMAALVRTGLQRPKRRKKTRRTRGSNKRRLEGKKRRGQLKKQRKKPDKHD